MPQRLFFLPTLIARLRGWSFNTVYPFSDFRSCLNQLECLGTAVSRSGDK